jgi:2,4-dichlorophenol 6-monooxygenase
MDVVMIGRDVVDPGDGWTRILELDPAGAILVRPDQHVAWRSGRVADPSTALARALAVVLDRAALAA